jgi:hypothetical protein
MGMVAGGVVQRIQGGKCRSSGTTAIVGWEICEFQKYETGTLNMPAT